MENYKEEIAKLQTQLDELKSKIEKPQFKVGKWYKGNENSCVFSVLFYCTKVDGDKLYGYGLVNNNWTENNSSINIADDENECVEATPKEVEEALTKEAVKRFPIGTKFESVSGLNEFISTGKFIKGTNWEKCLFRADSDGSKNGIVFKNGTWATPIKTKTIEELVNDIVCEYPMQKFSLDVFIKQYLTENKQEIIETLNNL